MAKIVIDIESCQKCPHHHESPYPSMDSFERPSYWWCKNPDVEVERVANDSEGERRRKVIKKDHGFEKLSYIAGYVEWSDKINIPDFCPIKIKDENEEDVVEVAKWTWKDDMLLLEDNNWVVECESPFEIRHSEDGSFASGQAAQMVLDDLKEENGL